MELVEVAACSVLMLDRGGRALVDAWHFCKGTRFGLNLLTSLKMENVMGFRNFTRLTPTDFEKLLQLLGGTIQDKESRFRKTIPLSLKLAVTDHMWLMRLTSINVEYERTAWPWGTYKTVRNIGQQETLVLPPPPHLFRGCPKQVVYLSFYFF